MIQIDIGSIEFNTGSPDGNGATWIITEYNGWEAPNVSFTAIELVGRAGSIAPPNFIHTRTLTYKGVVLCPSSTVFYTSLNALMAQAFDGLNTPLRITHHEDVNRYCDGLLSIQPQVKKLASHFEFQVSFTCIDPFKYTEGATSSALSASFTATNSGTGRTYPVLTTTSSGPVVITNQSLTDPVTLSIDTVPSGTVIDFGAPSVMSGTTNYYNQVLDGGGNWWALQPGANTITHTGASGTLSWHDAWN